MRPIDADALIKDHQYKGYHTPGEEDPMVVDVSDIEDAPTFEPAPAWTPCSEGPPEDDRLKLVTAKHMKCFEGDSEPSPERTVFEAYYKDGRWLSVWDTPMVSSVILAWQPLPEPYRGA